MADARITGTSPAVLTRDNLDGATLTVTLTGDTFVGTAPAKPLTLTAAPGDKRVVLTWTATADASITKWEYRIRTYTNARWNAWGSPITVPSGAAGTRTVTDTGLVNNQLYGYQVRSFVRSQASPWSDAAEARPVAVYTPAKPTALTVASRSLSVLLSWSAATDSRITDWQYRQKTGTGSYGSWTTISGSSSSTRSYTVTGLTDGTSYSFQVRSRAGTAGSPASVERSATPQSFTKPDSLTAASGNARVVLTWTEATGDSNRTGWEVQRRTGTGAWGNSVTVSGGSTLTTTITGLTNGTAYGFRVRATGASGRVGLWSDEATATPTATITFTTGTLGSFVLAATGVTITRTTGTCTITGFGKSQSFNIATWRGTTAANAGNTNFGGTGITLPNGYEAVARTSTYELLISTGSPGAINSLFANNTTYTVTFT